MRNPGRQSETIINPGDVVQTCYCLVYCNYSISLNVFTFRKYILQSASCGTVYRLQLCVFSGSNWLFPGPQVCPN